MRTAIIAALAVGLFSTSALSQTNVDTDASAASQSTNQNQIIVGGNGDGSSDKNVDYDGGVKNVPNAIAPMITGGANPCVVGMSGAGSFLGFGASVGGTWNADECERRNLAIIHLNSAAKFDNATDYVVAMEILCADEEVQRARRLAGEPCLRDQQEEQQATREETQQADNAPQESDEPFWCDQRSERIQRNEPACSVD